MSESLQVKWNSIKQWIHVLSPRPKVEHIDKLVALKKFCDGQDLTIIHGSSHVEIYDGKEKIAQAFMF